MSTSIELDRVWLHVADDLADAVGLRHRPLAGVHAVDGGVRVYGNGRRRLIRRAGVSEPVDIDVIRCTRAAYEWLLDRLGTTLLLRDPHGRRRWGVVLDLPWGEWPFADDTLASLELTFEPVTFDESA